MGSTGWWTWWWISGTSPWGRFMATHLDGSQSEKVIRPLFLLFRSSQLIRSVPQSISINMAHCSWPDILLGHGVLPTSLPKCLNAPLDKLDSNLVGSSGLLLATELLD